MNNAVQKIKLYWTEEQEIFQKLLGAIFTPDTAFEVIQTGKFGEFKSISQDLTLNPVDVLLVGCNNMSQQILDALEEIRKTHSNLGIVILASVLKYEDVPALKGFLTRTHSACGIIFKKSLNETEQLFATLTMVKSGQVVLDPKLANLISSEKDKSALSRGLTTREMEILNLISRGFTNIAISDSLCIDVKTVRHHINNMYSKLKASTEFDNRHPRVSATNIYLRLTGQLTFDEHTALE
jgi:two-component system, NarL family, response regulator LiaR